MPVIRRVPHRNAEADAEAADEIRVFVAVEDEGMRHADTIAAGVEVQTNGKREPFALAFGLMFSVDFNDGPNGAGLFDYERVNLAGEFFYARSLIRAVLTGAA